MLGFFGKNKASNNKEIRFFGATGQVSSIKCLLLAGVRGVAMDTSFTSNNKVDTINSYQRLGEDNKLAPTITQGDYSVSGIHGIQTYINIRGNGPSLVPKKARTLGQQNYWIELCRTKLAPAMQNIIDEKASEQDRQQCKTILERLDTILSTNTFIVGELSLADPNVAAYLYMLKINEVELGAYANIERWLTSIENEMSGDLRERYISLLTSEFKHAT